MPVLDEIAAKLAAVGLGTVLTNIFTASLPASPHVCCAVRSGGGLPPEMGFGTAGIHFETPSVQIVFRGEPHDQDGPMNRALTAYSELSKVEVATLSAPGGTSAAYHWIHPQQPPFVLRQDENERYEVVFNVLARKELSA